MKTARRPCPVALYIGRCFADRRMALRLSVDDVAERMACATQVLEAFERGDAGLDVLFVFQLSRVLAVHYRDYKPPVSYFGFLGFTSTPQTILRKAQKVVRMAKREFRHPQTRRNLENALLQLRYAPLRGPKEI